MRSKQLTERGAWTEDRQLASSSGWENIPGHCTAHGNTQRPGKYLGPGKWREKAARVDRSRDEKGRHLVGPISKPSQENRGSRHEREKGGRGAVPRDIEFLASDCGR